MTRIRQVAPLLHIINFNNLYFRVENETTLICAKNSVDLSSISEVRSYITEWPRFIGPPCILRISNYTGTRTALALSAKKVSAPSVRNIPVRHFCA